MSAPWYTPSGTPATNAQGASSDMRSEFALIETAMDLLPALTANGIVTINAGGTAMETLANLTVAKGGTGVATLTDGGVLLGSGTGAITAMAVLADGEMIVGDGTTDPVAESGATLRTSIGLGSLATQSNINDSDWSGTDLTVANGGTGASTLTDGGVLLGSGTGAITAMGVLADGEMIVGDGTTDPVAESGATLRTSIGLGSLATQSNINDSDWSGTDLTVANGGTGVSTLTDGGVLLGSGTGAITALGQPTNGQLVVGSTGLDPVLATLTAGANITINNTAGAIEIIAAGGGGGTVTNVATAGTVNGLTLTGGPITTTGTVTLGGTLAINNNDWSGSDLAVINGGTGTSSLTSGGVLLGSGTGSVTAMAALADSEMIVGDGTTDPVAESGATLRTSIGVGTADAVSFAAITGSGILSIDDTTASTSTTTGSIHTDGGLGVVKAIHCNGHLVRTHTNNTITRLGASAGLNVTGLQNTVFGDNALSSLTSGTNCTAVGASALSGATGSGNTAVGRNSGSNITSGTNNVILGDNNQPGSATGISRVVIGTGVSGAADHQVTIGSTSGNIRNEFDTDNAWTQSSDRRKKTNIKTAAMGLDFILDLRPVTYNLRPVSEWPKEWGTDPNARVNTKKTMHSFIAQEVLEALENNDIDPDTFAGWGEDREGQRISKEMFVFPLVNAVKELAKQLDELRGTING